MPIRLRAKPLATRDMSPVSVRLEFDLPEIEDDDSFRQVATKLSVYFVDAIELPSTFEQLRTTPAGNCVRVLVDHLKATCRNPATVHALLALKWHYAADQEHRGLSETRSGACEIVAWRLLARLSEREAMDFCLYEIPDAEDDDANDVTSPQPQQPRSYDQEAAETSPLLPPGSSSKKAKMENSLARLTNDDEDASDDADPTSAFRGLNALEIAAIANAKRFLSQHPVQRIVSGIWNGDIIFWDSLSVRTTKGHTFYDPETSDPFSRLRVPKYLKSWEVLFFAIFLCLYYAVLVARVETHITATEITLFIWIAAFAYDELSEWMDAGSIFYATDIWNLFDMIMILIGFIFATLRIVGQVQHDPKIIGLSFDVLSLEALFMMPRICSILSLSPYWGTLIPCLKEMGKDFIKFMVLVVIIYLGFLTTFSLVGRDSFNLSKMTGILTRIFFGSSYVGLDIMSDIDPFFGPPLMIIFVTLTSILLTGSLTGMLSNSFSRVITHAKEEYLYVYSVYVMEACTSNRLTHFYPPFNLIALVIFRPLRLVFSRDEKFRAGRIVLLKVTHLPIVAAIKLYELFRRKFSNDKPTSGHSRHHQWQPVRDMNALRPDDKRDDDDVEAPTGIEVQVAEMNRKIDKLTSAVLALQANKNSTGAGAAP
ncbi:ion transport protein [Hirsutella rhossiliensis]|uniref:Ion transport protein n=1 Tax=Hirsutella rhossiliensis TaxID=111463 RepID=A0A9P8N444_9HYPO|nr:ion transport protein [Hirsutella rhossiliensis]KAH0966555.1 ion transport protein [Hirsutella rhossiliensis]